MSTATVPSSPAVEHFEGVYRQHSPGIRAFIGQRLVHGDEYLVEDLTAETFMTYWRSFVLRDRYSDAPVFNLLATIARRRAWNYRHQMRSVPDVPVDFEDTSRWRLDALTANGLDTGINPEQIARDLDAALDVMSAAGKEWRRTRRVVTGIKAGAASLRARCGAAHAAKFTDSIAVRLARAELAEQVAMGEFLAARAEVGRLRDLLYP